MSKNMPLVKIYKKTDCNETDRNGNSLFFCGNFTKFENVNYIVATRP